MIEVVEIVKVVVRVVAGLDFTRTGSTFMLSERRYRVELSFQKKAGVDTTTPKIDDDNVQYHYTVLRRRVHVVLLQL